MVVVLLPATAFADNETAELEKCTIVGTEGPDWIIGTALDDVICGLGGDDIIDGGAGDDLVLGGTGDDVLRGGEGVDVVYGGDGDDRLFDEVPVRFHPSEFRDPEFGTDELDGGAGTDRCAETNAGEAGCEVAETGTWLGAVEQLGRIDDAYMPDVLANHVSVGRAKLCSPNSIADQSYVAAHPLLDEYHYTAALYASNAGKELPASFWDQSEQVLLIKYDPDLTRAEVDAYAAGLQRVLDDTPTRVAVRLLSLDNRIGGDPSTDETFGLSSTDAQSLLAPIKKGGDFRVRLVPACRSSRDVRSEHESLLELQSDLFVEEGSVSSSVIFDPLTEQFTVEIGGDLTGSARDELIADARSNVPEGVEVVHAETDLVSGTRLDPSSPYWGSERIDHQGSSPQLICTTAFAVRENANQLLMATAAHCSPSGTPHTQTWRTASGVWVGSNVFDEWPNEDVMALGTHGPYQYERKLWGGPNSIRTVTERWPAIDFNNWGTKKACHLGRTQSAAKCTNTVTGPHTTMLISAARGTTTLWLYRAKLCTGSHMANSGDSGAGVWVNRGANNVAVIGLLNGRGQQYKGLPGCQYQRWFSFTPLGQVENSMGVIAETVLGPGSTW